MKNNMEYGKKGMINSPTYQQNNQMDGTLEQLAREVLNVQNEPLYGNNFSCLGYATKSGNSSAKRSGYGSSGIQNFQNISPSVTPVQMTKFQPNQIHAGYDLSHNVAPFLRGDIRGQAYKVPMSYFSKMEVNHSPAMASTEKRLSMMAKDDDYSKTLEQAYSPNHSSINIENLRKNSSQNFAKNHSGVNSPQIKSKSVVGCLSNLRPQNCRSQSQQRTRSKERSQSRKKRNLNSSMGSYYPGSQLAGGQPPVSGGRVSKRKMLNNFLENMEKMNQQVPQSVNQSFSYQKKNPNNVKGTKEYFEADLEKEYASNAAAAINNKSVMLDPSHFNSKNNSIIKHLEHSFQLSHSNIQKTKRPVSQMRAGTAKGKKKNSSSNVGGAASTGRKINKVLPAHQIHAAYEYAGGSTKSKHVGKGTNDSRCSNKGHDQLSASQAIKAFNNTSSTTITSNRKNIGGEVLLSAKRGIQEPQLSDRAIRMTEFLKQIDGGSTEKLDRLIHAETERDQISRQMRNLLEQLKQSASQRRQTDYEGRLNDLQTVFGKATQISVEAPELLQSIKEGYEEVFNGVVEALASQIEASERVNKEKDKLINVYEVEKAETQKKMSKLEESNKQKNHMISQQQAQIERLTKELKQLQQSQINMYDNDFAISPNKVVIPKLDLSKLQTSEKPKPRKETFDSEILDSVPSGTGQEDEPFNAEGSRISFDQEDTHNDELDQAFIQGSDMQSLARDEASSSNGGAKQDSSPIIKPMIPPLNLGVIGEKKQSQQMTKVPPLQLVPKAADACQEYGPSNQQMMSNKQGKPQFGLNLAKMPEKQDFQDEFMSKYHEFSESWRAAVKQTHKVPHEKDI